MTTKTLVLLPGLMCDAAVWAPQVQALSASHHCMVMDWGLTDSLTAMAQQVLAAAPATFALAGHSMGGRVALEVMRLAPERVERLALLDTGVHPLAEGEAGAKEKAGRMALLSHAQRAGMRAMGAMWARPMVHPAVVGGPVFEQVLAMLERSSPAQFAAQIGNGVPVEGAQVKTRHFTNARMELQSAVQRFEQTTFTTSGFADEIHEFALPQIQTGLREDYFAVLLANIRVRNFYD